MVSGRQPGALKMVKISVVFLGRRVCPTGPNPVFLLAADGGCTGQIWRSDRTVRLILLMRANRGPLSWWAGYRSSRFRGWISSAGHRLCIPLRITPDFRRELGAIQLAIRCVRALFWAVCSRMCHAQGLVWWPGGSRWPLYQWCSYLAFLCPIVPTAPWMVMLARGKFYKVDSLAMATRISHNYQVLLDNGNTCRIIIPQGNFKFSRIVLRWWDLWAHTHLAYSLFLVMNLFCLWKMAQQWPWTCWRIPY